MERTLIKDTITKIGETVLLQGWVNIRRDHGKIIFIDLRDRSGLIQVVMNGEQGKDLRPEFVVSVEGLVKARPEKLINPNLPTGTVEIEAQKVEVISRAAELPFDMSKEVLDVELPTLLDYRALTLRHPRVQAIFKVQEVVIDAFRRALKAKDFMEFQAPSIISSAPEGGAEIFEVKYFDRKAYLAQSPQLYKSLLVSDFERVFSVNKIFRAEPSVTTRHLTEVVSLDAEFGFIKDWFEVKDMAEYVIKFILNEVNEKCSKELAMFSATIPLVSDKIPFLKLREAQQVIFERTGRDCRAEKDPSPEDEREICKWSKEKYGSDLVFITHYPTKYRPFYTYPDDEDPEYNQGFDLIGRGTEWMTGGRRLNNYETLMQHVKQWGITPENIELYLQAFRYGMPPLGGFAFGAERITMHILGLKNVREACLFPRDMERIDTRLSQSASIQAKVNISKPNVFEEIVKLLDKHKIKYQSLEHEAVFTSEESAKVRGTKIEQGAKALVMMADNKPILAVLSAAKKANVQQLKELVGSEKLKMASASEVKELTDLEIGSIPPFGSVLGLATYLDESLSTNKQIAFNAGSHTKSIIMDYADYLRAENPKVGSFTE